ncbi:MtrAB system histidine kinase MtrB [Kineosporia babensis]|uniref:Sensor histidine kinase MtrB n=1 Tax=Kineosporia babensis TaxID=499548 RepID=A0A9X1SXP9_9ACTN|nr:MtrAB system histidine kinase MtrB [Kineosporia babensis]MCD5315430.1 HAMP domain-containing histidine kinase [Kineosporia babensis]
MAEGPAGTSTGEPARPGRGKGGPAAKAGAPKAGAPKSGAPKNKAPKPKAASPSSVIAIRAPEPPRPRGPVRRLTGRIRRSVLSRIKKLLKKIRRRWSRSMRLRVVATTMLLGLGVVLVVGNFLLMRIRDGLIDSRTETAMAEAAALTQDANKLLAANDYQDPARQESDINDLLAQLQGPDGPDNREVVLRRAQRSTQPTELKDRATRGIPFDVIPQTLRDAVNSRGRQQSQITTVPTSSGEREPALAVGTIINIPLSGDYELYFVFPLERENQILDLVRGTLLPSGLGLVLLVGGVAYVITRQVVTPIRQAAKTAEQLASGRLDRRMKVRGQDDIARLGRAFNGMAASLERQIHQLEELSRVQRRFVSDVSHELRTPLTTIRMASEVIHESRDDLGDPILRRSAELLQAQVDRFELLLGDLLEISRFDAGAAVLDVDSADVREVAERVVDNLLPLAERKGSTIVLQLSLQPCVAQIDSRRVERVVRNLVGNAIEHGEGRPIEVQVAESADAVAIAVRDHGVGLSSEELSMVFNRFWRADPARARTIGGTGLGLSISQEDAHLHGGWLQVWGEPGVGAVFRLTLPKKVGALLVGSPLPLVPHLGQETGSLPALTAGPEIEGQLEEPEVGSQP